MRTEYIPDRVIENSAALRKHTGNGMLSKLFARFNQMTKELNERDGFFRLQLNLGHLLTFLGMLIPLSVMWVGQIQSNAVIGRNIEVLNAEMDSQIKTTAASGQAITEHSIILKDMAGKLDSVDKIATQAMIDDDRLSRVQADIKEIRARLENLKP